MKIYGKSKKAKRIDAHIWFGGNCY